MCRSLITSHSVKSNTITANALYYYRRLVQCNKPITFIRVIRITIVVPVAQRIRRETTNLKIAGSNPVGDIRYKSLLLFLFVNSA